MDTENTRVTRAQAAALVGVSQRTINRWSAAGAITPRYGPVGSTEPATYDRAEVEAEAAAWKIRVLARTRLDADGAADTVVS